ncbi:MAG: hypothetical protein AAF734_09310, partial [Bacteroidota bacterium]
MRLVIYLTLIACWMTNNYVAYAQESNPLVDWYGTWQGDLQITTPEGKVQKIPMELQIYPTDSAGYYRFSILYNQSPRHYVLQQVDTSKGHYVMDEKNGILLDTYLINRTFISQFEVMGNLLTSSYELQADRQTIISTIYSSGTKVIRTSGNRPE